jgi:hypothetical protein
MDPKKAKRNRMARRTNIVLERHNLMDDAYELVTLSNNQITDTGLLTVAELRPKLPETDLPTFRFRWDEKGDHLNIDALNADDSQISDFKSGKGGYEGHLPLKLTSNARTFQVYIIWNNRTLFIGNITIPLGFDVSAKVAVGVHVSASVEVLRTCQICGNRFKVENNEKICTNCRTQDVKTHGSSQIDGN